MPFNSDTITVYKQYTQQLLDNQYNNRLHVPDYATYIERWKQNSLDAAQKYPCIKDIAYGQHQRECLDIFPSLKPHSKTLVFIHGGYWQMFSKDFFHFVVAGFYEHDITIVFINYPLAPEATMDQMVSSCRKALLWLHHNIEQYNGDTHQLFIAGHSAGGHLASLLMEQEWIQFNKVNFIKGICTLSGIFLEPIELCYLNTAVKLTKEMALRNSTVAVTPVNSCPLLLFVGAGETDEFKYQSEVLYHQWKQKITDITLVQLTGIHHFSMVETLVDKNAPVHIALCKLMGI
jgi:arylformamidase